MSDIFRDFGKKNEVPKVKIPKFATGGICNNAIFPKFDAFSQIDEIVKDIAKKKDNAMAMEFTKCIGELLKKNGVTPKITEYSGIPQTDKTFETRYGVSIDELDFSEHDKVFKDEILTLKKTADYYDGAMKELRTRCTESARDKFDKGLYDCLTVATCPNEMKAENTLLRQQTKYYEDKIAKLEKELEEWEEEAKESKKNRDEQLKSVRKAVEPYVDIGHMHETIAELKQRIAELESMETENFSEIDTSNPLACAESLIEHMTHCEKFMIMPERDVQTFSVEELKEIADYLMVYYKHHKDRDAEDTISF